MGIAREPRLGSDDLDTFPESSALVIMRALASIWGWSATESLYRRLHSDPNGALNVIPGAAGFPVTVGGTVDVSDRAARLLGVVNSITNAVDISDRMARLLGAVNLSQVGGTVIASVPVPSGGFGQVAIPVAPTIRKATYYTWSRNVSSGALAVNVNKQILSLEHAAISTKTVRVRKITVAGLVTVAGGPVASDLSVQLTRGSAASSAGTVRTITKANAAQPNEDTVVKELPTIVAGTFVYNRTLITTAAAGLVVGTLIPATVVYDYSEDRGTEPLTIRPLQLESLVINLISNSTPTVTFTVEIEFTEE